MNTSGSAHHRWVCQICKSTFARKSSWVRHQKSCPRPVPVSRRPKACFECQRTKLKCDLLPPLCNRCESRNVLCEWPDQVIQTDPDDAPAASPPLHGALEEAIMVVNPSDTLIRPDVAHTGFDTNPFTAPMDAPPSLAQQPIVMAPTLAMTTPVALHEDHAAVGDVTEDVVDPIRDRWMNPLLDINAPSSKLAGHSMEFLFRVLRTYPRMLAQDDDLACPIVHTCQLLPGNVRTPLSNCIAIARMWDGHNKQSTTMIESTIGQEMQRLIDAHATYDEEDLLAAMQALLMYAIMLFFLPEKDNNRNRYFDHIKMMKLHEVAHRLAKTGLTLAEETARTPPEWEDWIRITAKARTILAFFCFEWAFSAYNHLLSYHCHEIGFILAPTSKLLWLATTKEEWERRYGRWLLRWRSRNFFRMSELMAVPLGVRVDDRVNAWLAETDEFGMMIMTLVNATE